MAKPDLYISSVARGGDGVVLHNNMGQELWVTREFAAMVAGMLVEACTDIEDAYACAEEWSGRGDELSEQEDEAYRAQEEDDMLVGADRISLDEMDDGDLPTALNADRYHPDESRIDLGGGMVVPLSELMEDDD